MDLFGIGFGELILILIVALIVFGPGRLPEIARTIGRMYKNLARTSSEFTTAIKKEIDLEEMDKGKKSNQVLKDRNGQGNPDEEETSEPDGKKDT
jgi:sec-independent protein translocase protein TatA